MMVPKSSRYSSFVTLCSSFFEHILPGYPRTLLSRGPRRVTPMPGDVLRHLQPPGFRLSSYDAPTGRDSTVKRKLPLIHHSRGMVFPGWGSEIRGRASAVRLCQAFLARMSIWAGPVRSTDERREVPAHHEGGRPWRSTCCRLTASKARSATR